MKRDRQPRIPELGFSGSWIISDRATGKAVIELYERATVERINQAKYLIEPAHVYLARFNRSIQESK